MQHFLNKVYPAINNRISEIIPNGLISKREMLIESAKMRNLSKSPASRNNSDISYPSLRELNTDQNSSFKLPNLSSNILNFII